MRLPLLAALAAVMVLTSCGAIRESRLNPFNWFGRSEARQTGDLVPAEIADPRPLVDQVLSMVVEPYPGGAIVRATGLSPTQGYYKAELVPREVDENGVLVYDFRILPPPEPKRVGAQQTREVTVAATLTTADLEGLREIVVQGGQNARSSRR